MKREPGSYTGLTVAQADMLSFLRKRHREGYTPTFDEMQGALGLTSKSHVSRLLVALEERGYIDRLPNRARAITVYAEPVKASILPTPTELRRVPLSAMLEELNRRGFRAVRANAA
jgi:repressor LexA